MPVLVLERHNINKELKVVDSRLTNHFHLILHIISSKLGKRIGQTIETRLYTITILIIESGRLPTYFDREIDALGEAGHKLVAGAELDVIAHLAGHVDTDTWSSSGDGDVEILEHAVLLHPRAEIETAGG